MNWAAIFSFLHPMLSVIIASGLVLMILKKEYSMYLNEDIEIQTNKANELDT